MTFMPLRRFLGAIELMGLRSTPRSGLIPGLFSSWIFGLTFQMETNQIAETLPLVLVDAYKIIFYSHPSKPLPF